MTSCKPVAAESRDPKLSAIKTKVHFDLNSISLDTDACNLCRYCPSFAINMETHCLNFAMSNVNFYSTNIKRG